jgi:hypothetical protein
LFVETMCQMTKYILKLRCYLYLGFYLCLPPIPICIYLCYIEFCVKVICVVTIIPFLTVPAIR